MEYCVLSELHPVSAGLGGRPFRAGFAFGFYPGLKPWAILLGHFMAYAASERRRF
jgi:hypothetical protein